jgi:alkylation response protein AidB-like acyl-CoA dehydrogenase
MRLALTDDQTLLAKTAAAFALERSPLSRLRALRAPSDPLGYSKPLWSQMAALGWTGIPFAEDHGGAGLGLAEVVIVTEALGRCLAPEPFLSSVMLAGRAIARAGSDAQRAAHLAPVIAGEKILALALDERGTRYDRRRIATRAEKTAAGRLRVTGEKSQVIDGFGADAFVVATRTAGNPGDAGGVTLALVAAGAPGLSVVRQHRVDGRNAALVQLAGVEVSASDVLGRIDQGGDVLDDVVDAATVALAGEMVGGMVEALDRTLVYLRERVQFGVSIGTFQALKHRAARVFVEVELARSAVLAAARAIDEASDHRRALVSAAKARASDAYVHAANEAIQMHGGIGMTDEHDIGLFLKRARVAEMTFGDAAFHRDRFATACGF